MLDNTMVVTTREALVAIILSVVIVDASIISAKAINTYHYYEIDFTYTNVINGNSYIEEATLLRDNQWLEENNIHKTGDTLVLNIPEFGVVNAKATAKEVKATNFNPESFYTNNQSMVTGTFKHYSVDVREYTLQDSKTGITQDIQATPNHAFYVQNRTAFNKALNEQSHFIEIQNITPKDYMLNEAGNSVKLVCKQNQITINQDNGKVYNCYKQLVTNNKPIAVYNLEIYKQHQYLVFSNKDIKNNNIIEINSNKELGNNKHSDHIAIAFNSAVLVHNMYQQQGADVAGPSGLWGGGPMRGRANRYILSNNDERYVTYFKHLVNKGVIKEVTLEDGTKTLELTANSHAELYETYVDSSGNATRDIPSHSTETGRNRNIIGFGGGGSGRAGIYQPLSRPMSLDEYEQFILPKIPSKSNPFNSIYSDIYQDLESQRLQNIAPIANPIADFDTFFDNAVAGNFAQLGSDPIVHLLPEPLLPDLGANFIDDFFN